jgi:hypothetical protein
MDKFQRNVNLLSSQIFKLRHYSCTHECVMLYILASITVNTQNCKYLLFHFPSTSFELNRPSSRTISFKIEDEQLRSKLAKVRQSL